MITTIDPSLAIRGKILAALRSDAALTAIIPASRIYKSQTPSEPTWPFIRLGVLMNAPLRLDGGSGGDVTGAVHCFTKGGDDPEAMAMQINAHVARILDSIDDTEADELDIGVHVTQSQVMEDGSEASAYHGIVSIRATAT
ncbi:DUF3168 domain-containing protein [Sphingobium sp. CFD-1]|uniref:DUF3168 domain-containing protein n=1 Tax=Sphingobium sp. CFD-1 TaxID=2878545 RepID=UPI00214B897F|nr:DUF3168 domain-containing protein [Sphingobium sp. CFD-1]